MPSGESGIRTHAPFRTNGFQDRLVMTTSISLRMCVHFLVIFVVCLTTKAILTKRGNIVNTFLHNFYFNFFKWEKAHFIMVPGFFSFALNTVFFQNCVQNHSIVTIISTIWFLYLLYPCIFPGKVYVPADPGTACRSRRLFCHPKQDFLFWFLQIYII